MTQVVAFVGVVGIMIILTYGLSKIRKEMERRDDDIDIDAH